MPKRFDAALERWFSPGWIRNSVITLLGILVVTVGGVVALWFGSTLSIDQRIAGISAVITAAALAVAVLAAILAIEAYRFATRRPNLIAGFSSARSGGALRIITPYVVNAGEASALSVRVVLTFDNATIVDTDWAPMGTSSFTADVANVHPGPLVNLSSFVIGVDDNDREACIRWSVHADRVNIRGRYALNPRPITPDDVTELTT
jgi:hypothetical protein